MEHRKDKPATSTTNRWGLNPDFAADALCRATHTNGGQCVAEDHALHLLGVRAVVDTLVTPDTEIDDVSRLPADSRTLIKMTSDVLRDALRMPTSWGPDVSEESIHQAVRALFLAGLLIDPTEVEQHHWVANSAQLCSCGESPVNYGLPTDMAQWWKWEDWHRAHVLEHRGKPDRNPYGI